MKSIEYFEKYKDTIDTNMGVVDLILEMSNEVTILAEERNALSNSAVVAIIKEVNKKWNAVAGLFAEEYGYEILNTNAFMDYWRSQMTRS